MDENMIAARVIGASIEVHRTIGPGLLESAYQECLAHELGLCGMDYEREVPLAVGYKGLVVGTAYRFDFLVESKLVVELKSIEKVTSLHKAQLLTYLKLSSRKLGLLINFNSELLRYGVYRVVNNL